MKFKFLSFLTKKKKNESTYKEAFSRQISLFGLTQFNDWLGDKDIIRFSQKHKSKDKEELTMFKKDTSDKLEAIRQKKEENKIEKVEEEKTIKSLFVKDSFFKKDKVENEEATYKHKNKATSDYI